MSLAAVQKQRICASKSGESGGVTTNISELTDESNNMEAGNLTSSEEFWLELFTV